MYSCAGMNGQHQVLGPTMQQATCEPTTNQQTLYYPTLHRDTGNAGSQPPTRPHIISGNGLHHNYGTERFHLNTVRHQPAWNSHVSHWQASHNNVQIPSSNLQIGNTSSHGTPGLSNHVYSPQTVPSHYSPSRTQSNLVKPNTGDILYANEQQSGRTSMLHNTQDQPVQQYNVPQGGTPCAGQIPYTTALISLSNQYPAWKDSRGPVTGNQQQAAFNQYQAQNNTQERPNVSVAPPAYSSSSQFYKSSGATRKLLPNGQTSSVFATSKKTQVKKSSHVNVAPAKMKKTAHRTADLDAIAKARKESPILMTLLDALAEPKNSITANDPNTREINGHTAPKVVCVVQPLSQESCTILSQNTALNKVNQETADVASDAGFNYGEKTMPAQAVAENNMAPNPSELLNSCRFQSSDSPAHVPQKNLSADDGCSKPASDIQLDHPVIAASEVAESRQGERDTSDPPPYPQTFGVSTVPTTQWTIEELRKLIKDADRAQMESKTISDGERIQAESETISDGENVQMKSKPNHLFLKLITMFWNGSTHELKSKLKLGWLEEIRAESERHVGCLSDDAVILSEVKKEHLSHLHVLQHDDIYTEPPYTSSWRNINVQLDDIDKELGFPRSLRQGHHAPESHCREDCVLTGKKAPVQIEGEQQNKLALEKTKENQVSAVEVTSAQNASPATREDAESTDTHCSFEIQVLDPEEAKIIFAGLQAMSQSRETTSDSTGNKALGKIEKYCCISKWKEAALGSNISPSNECSCDDSSIQTSPDTALHWQEQSAVKDGNDADNIQMFSWIEEISDDEDVIIFTPEDKAVSSNENNVYTPPPDPSEEAQWESAQEPQQESTQNDHSASSGLSDNLEIAKETSPFEEDCDWAAPMSPSVCDNEGVENEEEKEQCQDAKLPPLRLKLKKHKRKSSPDRASSEPGVKRAKLTLFGSSSQQQQPSSAGRHERHKPLLKTPRVLYVNFGHGKSKPPAAPNYSVKKLIHERWSLPPTRISSSDKPNRHARPFANPGNHRELSGLSSEKMRRGKVKRMMNPKGKSAFKMGKRGVFKLKRLDSDGSNAEGGSPDASPVCERTSLKFIVLPESFDFKDGCRAVAETADDVQTSPIRSKNKQGTPNAKRVSGPWNTEPAKKYCPLSQPPVQKGGNVFREFQKKYQKTHAPSND